MTCTGLIVETEMRSEVAHSADQRHCGRVCTHGMQRGVRVIQLDGVQILTPSCCESRPQHLLTMRLSSEDTFAA